MSSVPYNNTAGIDHNNVSNCFHCGLPLPLNGTVTESINSEKKSFCCHGCAQVSRIIHDSQLDKFYRFAPSVRQWGNPQSAPADALVFDDPELQQEFVCQLDNDLLMAEFLVQGIHCPACIWLIEKMVYKNPGIEYCEVNFTKHSMKVAWDPGITKVSDIIHAVGKIGYRAQPFDQDEHSQLTKQRRQNLLFRMTFAGFVMANVMTAAVCLYAGDFFGIEEKWRGFFKWYSMIFTASAVLYSGKLFFISAFNAIVKSRVNMDVPISLGITISFIYSVWATITANGHVYYDSICMFIFLILVGRYLESSARETAHNASHSLLALLPYSATKLENGEELLVPLRSIKPKDIILIRPGEKIPVDGAVIEGNTRIDESMLTGESIPVYKSEGDKVVAGTLNENGTIKIRTTRTGKHSTISNIAELIERAQNSKVNSQRLADMIVPYFVFGVIALSLLTFAYWTLNSDITLAITSAVTVLIITCPCALGLATPMAVAIGAGIGGKNGVLFKNGSSLELLHKTDHIIFDKTGTLTTGNIKVVNCGLPEDKTVLSYIASIEMLSEHFAAKAIVKKLAKFDVSNKGITIRNFSSTPGLGVSADVLTADSPHVTTIYIGSLQWLDTLSIRLDKQTRREIDQQIELGYTIVIALDQEKLLAWFGLSDTVRPEAKQLINNLLSRQFVLSVASGDQPQALRNLLSQLQTNEINIYPGCMPQDKLNLINAIKSGGYNVAMIGDGINDAPALAHADVGVAVAQAADISSQAANVVLIGGLEKLPVAIEISKITSRTIRQNLGFSLAYNIFVVPLAIMGAVSPLLAAIVMPLSSLVVIGNALLIRRRVNRFCQNQQRELFNGYYLTADTSGTHG